MAGALAALNFRDLGGLPIAGGRLRSGLLYRSEDPLGFAAAHHAELDGLGIRLVCDLRSPAERRADKGTIRWGARSIRCDIAADFRSGDVPDWTALGPALTADTARATMRSTYAAMPAALQPHLAGLVAAMLAGELPLMIHCTAGKDRTGVLVALLLRMLGTGLEAIVADYLLSERFAARIENRRRVQRQLTRILGCEVDEPVLDAVAGVDRSYIEAGFQTIDRRYGSFTAYLAEAGIGGTETQALRRLLADRSVAGPD